MCSCLGGPLLSSGPHSYLPSPPSSSCLPGGAICYTWGSLLHCIRWSLLHCISLECSGRLPAPSSELPPHFPPLAPPKCTAQPPNTDCCVFMGGQLSPGSFSSSWDLPNGGEGWLQSGIARQLALVGGVVARICTPRTLSGGFVLIRRSFFVCVVIGDGALLELSLLSLYTAAYRGLLALGGPCTAPRRC